MRTLTILMVFAAIGCGRGGHGGALPDGPAGRCPSGHEKLKFSREQSCANDGGVEFCIPTGDPPLQAKMQTISPTISCGTGGGRAGCLDAPRLFLCTYPTEFPGECTAPHGAMTDEVWSDMCEIAALPQVVEIVPTILE